MQYIKITNEGEIDLNAFFLMGASTKRNQENKIGFFGSGLKYGLATLLRDKVKIKIFSGFKEIKIKTKDETFREQTFHRIYINNKPTALTTEMGIDWKAWFAVREIYSNSIDEGESNIEIVDKTDVIPDSNTTSFFIEITEDIGNFLSKWEEYFSQKRKDRIFYNDDLKVFMGGDEYIIYRRGIQCHKEKTKSLFHYDLNVIDINESRTLKHGIDNIWRVAEVVKRNANKRMIKKIYDNQDEKYIENHFRWNEGNFNEDWLNVIGGRRIVLREVAGHYQEEIAKGNTLILNKNLVKALEAQFKNKIEIVGQSDKFGDTSIIKMDKKQEAYILESLDFLRLNGYEINNKIQVAIFINKEIYGQAMGDNILLSNEIFEQGKKKICETILEEYIHIKFQHNDCSRGMQNFLFNKIITMMEEKTAVYF